VLEAVEYLLKHGLSLQNRTVYLAFGHDEETAGAEGAASIAAHLRRQGVKFEFSYDEGLFIIDKIVPHYPRPVALICTAEKGFCTAEVKVSLAAEHAGHSAAPAATSAIAILSRALLRLHERKTPSYYGVKDRVMMEWLAHGFPFPVRLIVSNLWLFAPLMRRIMASKPQTAATVRTTTALTVLKAGEKSNVIPTSASALVNHRLHPADSVAGILHYDRHVICDHRVVVQQKGDAVEPSAVSSDSSPAFRALHESVLAVYPHVSIAPAVVVGGTDSKHYADLCQDLYRFSCIYMTDPSQTALFHGRDERIEQGNYVKTVGFYLTLLLKCDQQQGEAEGEGDAQTGRTRHQTDKKQR
jgi:carboxypeptidase PM20D1